MSQHRSNVAERPVREVWTVSRLNYEARALLDMTFGTVWVEGEISNLAQPRSGHIYFSLKDSSCQVRCAMFRGQNRHLRFAPENGQQVLMRARVGIYAERGDYQLVAEYMEESGAGALRRAFDALKARLESEGLFNADRKRPVPPMPEVIGVVTSPAGAAVRDVLSTLARRFPATAVIVYPVPVQGEAAPPAIVRMLELAAARGECDVLIVTRGGGSLEDLWAFNDERTARAIAACPIPIVCGVGHEIDFTIADFVADARAATPTAAAEMVSPDAAALTQRVSALQARLGRAFGTSLEGRRQQLALTRGRLVHPQARLRDYAQRLDGNEVKLQQAVNARLASARLAHARLVARLAQFHPRTRLAGAVDLASQLQGRLHRVMATAMATAAARHGAARRTLDTVGPRATLARGYAILTDEKGERVLRDAARSQRGDRVRALLARGEMTLSVEATAPAGEDHEPPR